MIIFIPFISFEVSVNDIRFFRSVDDEVRADITVQLLRTAAGLGSSRNIASNFLNYSINYKTQFFDSCSAGLPGDQLLQDPAFMELQGVINFRYHNKLPSL
jgi:hypothetical protein